MIDTTDDFEKAVCEDASSPIRVVIVDDHPAICQAIALALAAEEDIELVATVDLIERAIEVLMTELPDVAVVDLTLRDGSGLGLIELMRNRCPQVHAVVFTMRREEMNAEAAIRAGALGFVSKLHETDQLIKAIRAAYRGEVYLRRMTALKLVGKLVRKGGGKLLPVDRLTDRERSVFERIGAGMTVSAIASDLGISPRTVVAYRRRAKEKLGLADVNALIHESLRWAELRTVQASINPMLAGETDGFAADSDRNMPA